MIIPRFFREVFVHGEYEPVRELGNINIVLDIGACTGEFSLWQESRANRIYAIEPNKTLFNNLKENVSGFEKIEPFHLAISNWNGRGKIMGDPDGGGYLADRDTDETNVDVLTLATFMKRMEIGVVDCLKVDIEDGERRMFESEDFGEVAGKIKFIIGEHVNATAGGLLREYGFKEMKNGTYYKR